MAVNYYKSIYGSQIFPFTIDDFKGADSFLEKNIIIGPKALKFRAEI